MHHTVRLGCKLPVSFGRARFSCPSRCWRGKTSSRNCYTLMPSLKLRILRPLLALWSVDHERHRTYVPPNPRSPLACATNRVDESEPDLHTTPEIPAERASFS